MKSLTNMKGKGLDRNFIILKLHCLGNDLNRVLFSRHQKKMQIKSAERQKVLLLSIANLIPTFDTRSDIYFNLI